MKKISKAVLGIGVTAVAGLAVLPLTTYATETADVMITANITSTLTLSVSSATVALGTLTPGGAPSTGTTIATVVTNNLTGYTLNIRALAPANVNMVAGAATIPALTTPGALNATPTVSAWGFMGGSVTQFTGVPVADVAIRNTTTTTTSTGDNTTLTFGAFAADGQAAGNYSSTVRLTAVANT